MGSHETCEPLDKPRPRHACIASPFASPPVDVEVERRCERNRHVCATHPSIPEAATRWAVASLHSCCFVLRRQMKTRENSVYQHCNSGDRGEDVTPPRPISTYSR